MIVKTVGLIFLLITKMASAQESPVTYERGDYFRDIIDSTNLNDDRTSRMVRPYSRHRFDKAVDVELSFEIGQRVATLVQENRATGVYTIDLDIGLTSGVYIYHMSAFGAETGSQYVKTQKLLYVK